MANLQKGILTFKCVLMCQKSTDQYPMSFCKDSFGIHISYFRIMQTFSLQIVLEVKYYTATICLKLLIVHFNEIGLPFLAFKTLKLEFTKPK